jgi:hypothetical protein
MDSLAHPLAFLLLVFSGWINRRQQDVIDYLLEENRVLRAAHGSHPILLSDDQRRRLAVKGKALGRRQLADVAGIVTPDTILRWYRPSFRTGRGDVSINSRCEASSELTATVFADVDARERRSIQECAAFGTPAGVDMTAQPQRAQRRVGAKCVTEGHVLSTWEVVLYVSAFFTVVK